jgi:[ribosomal protein S5]-alanine N-acetyltransferase
MSRISVAQWPLVLSEGDLILRPLRYRDRGMWLETRRRNREWLSPWEATSPIAEENKNLPTYFEMVKYHQREGRAGRSLSLAIWFHGQLIGQITLGGISYGAYRGGHIGYWIDQSHANKGLTTRAVRELTRYGLEELGLHRIEINLRPENSASKRVAEKAGYVFEGLRPRYLHIDGAWRDHLCYVKENPRI